MKKAILLLAIVATGTSADAQNVSDFDDIDLWVGTGSNRAALVIDFHDGGSEAASEESWVWGFRWSGTATGFDMLSAVAAADVSLSVNSPDYIQVVTYSVGSNTYEQNSQLSPESWGYYIAGGSSTIYNDSFLPIGTFDAPNGGVNMPSSTQWSISTSGTQGRTLADGSWDAFSYGTYDPATYAHEVPPGDVAFAAIPEPKSVVLLLLAGCGLLWLKRGGRQDI